MGLAIFDLDNTLLAGDSDYAWGQFLIAKGIVERAQYEQANRYFYEQYAAGTLDIDEFAAFAYRPLATNRMEDLLQWRETFLEESIKPIILPQGRALIQAHRNQGDPCVIITATNRFITEPIARELGVPHLLATNPTVINGRFQASIAGTPCFQEGKVKRLQQWLDEQRLELTASTFYSDSRNDLPLLETVTYPVAVDPDPVLKAHAEARGWPVISLREQ